MTGVYMRDQKLIFNGIIKNKNSHYRPFSLVGFIGEKDRFTNKFWSINSKWLFKWKFTRVQKGILEVSLISKCFYIIWYTNTKFNNIELQKKCLRRRGVYTFTQARWKKRSLLYTFYKNLFSELWYIHLT